MNDKVNSILKHYKLTSSQFADEIGVQRSSVSHVLSGRNKPGFDFIRKIMLKFPEINAEWLLTGVGEMLKKAVKRETELFESAGEREIDKEKESKYNKHKDTEGISGSSEGTAQDKGNEKKIEKIIIIYKDKSFEEYHPT